MMENKYYMVINAENFKDEEGWQEKGWILKGLAPVNEKGLVKITNELERFYLEEEVYIHRLAELPKNEYDTLYNLHLNEDGWGDEEEDVLQTIYNKYTIKGANNHGI